MQPPNFYMIPLVKLTVRTSPVQGFVTIFRILGRYGIMTRGPTPQSAARAQPWTWLASFLPIVDAQGFTWYPETYQIQGLAQMDSTVLMRYIREDRLA